MQSAIAAATPSLIKALSNPGIPVDLHIGVVTSDYGAGQGTTACTPSPGGKRGLLQGVGTAAPGYCQSPTGAPYLHFVLDHGAVTQSNLPPGHDVPTSVGCMTAAGTSGCPFEHSLESVHSALTDMAPENAGFLRSDALLAVVFITNEDDGSAPGTTDVYDVNKSAQYGFFDSYSRQTRFSLFCGNPLNFPPYGDSGGPLSPCVPAPNPPPYDRGPGIQIELTRYLELFTQPPTKGGLKGNPADIVLAAAVGPREPFQVILSDPNTPAGVPYAPCAPLDELSRCVPVLQHSCINTMTKVSGDPAVRLDFLLRSTAFNVIGSVCDDDQFRFMGRLGLAMRAAIGGCVPYLMDTVPACYVEQVTFGEPPITIPECAANGTKPCWRIEAKSSCELASPGSMGLTVDRGGQPAPDGAGVTAFCTKVVPQVVL